MPDPEGPQRAVTYVYVYVPDPEGPQRAVTVPGWTVREIWSRTNTSDREG